MKVSEYIKDLLFRENYVIIPGFGGFVANYEGAEIDFNKSKMHPPKRVIAFNQKLVNNDGFLINEISRRENISYNNAEEKVNSFIKTLNERLEKGKTVYFNGLGEFKKKNSRLIFQPEKGVNFNADAYGLDSFSFQQLNTAYRQKKQVKKSMEPVKKKRRKVAVAPLIVGIPLIGALIYAPFYLDKNQKSDFNEAGIRIPIDTEKRKIKFDAADFNFESKKLKKTINESRLKSEKSSGSVVTSDNNYYIIGGSFSSRENAEDAVKIFKNKGFSPQILKAPNGYSRVAVKAFNTRNKAYSSLEEIRNSLSRQELWILKQ